MPLPTFTSRADNADIIHAEDVNELQREVAPIAAATLATRYSQVSTSTAITLTDSSYPLQSISSTASGLVTLPAYSTANHAFYIVNRSSSFPIDVKTAAAALVVSVGPATAATIYPDSVSGWMAGNGYTPPTTTAANDVQVGDGSGNWIKKTLAEFSTIIQTALDSIYLKLSDMSAANAATLTNGSNADALHTHTITLIEDKYLSSADVANFDFQSIPATFKFLKILLDARTDRAATADSVLMKLNNDAGNNYVGHIQWEGGTVEQATAAGPIIVTYTTGGNSPASWFSNAANLFSESS